MNYSLLVRYLNSECSIKEQYEIERWLEENPENRRFLKNLKVIWKSSELRSETDNYEFDAESDWKALLSRIKMDEQINMSAPGKKYKQEKSGIQYLKDQSAINSGFALFMRIAAVLMLAAVLGVFTLQTGYDFFTVEENEPAMREIVMDKGQRVNIVLPDGTYMTLNADSKINIPETFHPNHREVFLTEGEAFFEVSSDPEWPFLVHTGKAVIQVLGTAFAIRSYPEDEEIRVVVSEGSVSLSSRLDESTSTAISAGQLGRFQSTVNQIVTEEVEDMDLFLSWINGFLKFKETTMKQVAVQLERKYNIKVEFIEPELEQLKLTAEIRGRAIHNVLNVISASLEISYYEVVGQDDRRKIVFTNNPDHLQNG